MIQILPHKTGLHLELLINGKIIKSANVFGHIARRGNEGKYYEIFINDKKVINLILDYSLNDFPPVYILSFGVDLPIPLIKSEILSSIWLISDETALPNNKKHFRMLLEFHFDLSNWRGNYSLAEYYSELEQLAFGSNDFSVQMNDEDEGLNKGFSFELKREVQINSRLSDEVNYFIKIIEAVNGKLEERIIQGNISSFINLEFNFPEDLKVPCEQYLLYFAQFLKDLGINATPNLKEEAGKVLFSVTPNDDIEALDKIREALEVYLRLPSSPITSNSQEIAIQRLESQVEYFRSQIRLARAESQLKEATIQQQQVTIIKLGENVLIDSMVKPVSERKKSEKVVKGVEVGKVEELEKYGVIIDLGELFRTMKGWFKKKS